MVLGDLFVVRQWPNHHYQEEKEKLEKKDISASLDIESHWPLMVKAILAGNS